MRNTMIATPGGETVQYAHCRGISALEWPGRWQHESIIPGFTGFGDGLGFGHLGAMTEVVFSYPGQGYLLLNAVTSQDYPLMQGFSSASLQPCSLLTSWWISHVVG